MSRLLLAPFLNWARKLKHPALFKLVAALFVLTLIVPDPIFLLDELLLGLVTLLLANWKSRKGPDAEADADVDPPRREPIDGQARRS